MHFSNGRAPSPNVAKLRIVARLDVALFLADKAPNLIQFQASAGQIAHRGIHHGCAALSDSHAQTHDRIPVNTRHALNRPDAGTLSPCADHCDLLVGIE